RPHREYDGHRDQEAQQSRPVARAEISRSAPPPVRETARREQDEPGAEHEIERGAGAEPQRAHPQMVGVVPEEAEHTQSPEREREQDESAAPEPLRGAPRRGLAARPPERAEREEERGDTDEG